MKKYLFILSLLMLSSSLHAQEMPQREVVGRMDQTRFLVTADGSFVIVAAFGTINGELSVPLRNPQRHVTLRAGFANSAIIFDNNPKGGIVTAGFLMGGGPGFFELDGGLMVLDEEGRDNPIIYPVLTAGFRYMSRRPGPVFKLKIGTTGLGLGIGIVI